MSNLETYLLLFTDTLVSNFAFNISQEMAVKTMKIFGLHHSYLIIIIASFAYLLSMIVNYFLGKICYNILSNSLEEQSTPYTRITTLRENKYLFLLIILSAIPFFGKFIILFTGFCRIKLSKIIYLGIMAKIAYYSYFILT